MIRRRLRVKLLENRTVIVTGAGQGIGRALAKGLAAEGARVVIAELNGENGKQVQKDIEAAGGIAMAVRTDVSQEDSVNAMVAETLRAFKNVDVLINDAAIFPASSVAEMKTEEWEQVLRTNLTGTFFCCRAVMPTMKHNRSGRIINLPPAERCRDPSMALTTRLPRAASSALPNRWRSSSRLTGSRSTVSVPARSIRRNRKRMSKTKRSSTPKRRRYLSAESGSPRISSVRRFFWRAIGRRTSPDR